MAKMRISAIDGPGFVGEGPLVGTPSIFVRTGGCDYRCVWCDSLKSVLPEYGSDWRLMTHKEILTEVMQLSNNIPLLVTLTGGNPAIWDLSELILDGQAQGYKFALETQGSMFKPWLDMLDWLILSPKGPSSQNVTPISTLDKLVDLKPKTFFNVPIFNLMDYEYARILHETYPGIPLWLTVGNTNPPQLDMSIGINRTGRAFDMEQVTESASWLLDTLTADNWYNLRVGVQLNRMTETT